jgi:hypothetical protein
MRKPLYSLFIGSCLGVGSLLARTKTDTFAEIIGENPQSLLGVTKLVVVGIPNIPELTIDNPRTSPDGKITEGTGYIRWTKWGALRVEDVEVKDGKLELKVLGMLPTKNFIQKPGSADAVEARFNMVIGASGIEQTGFSVTVPEAKTPGGAFIVQDLTVTYNPPEIAMGAIFKLGPNGKGIGGAFSLWEGNFNGLALKGSDLDWKLGASGSKIDKVDIGFFNIQNPPWYVDGGFTVMVGETRVAGKWPLELEARGRFYSDYRVDIRGNAQIAGIPVGNAYLTYIPSFNVDAGAQVDLLSIIIGSAQIQARAGSLGGSISARVQVPPYVPLIGRWTLGGADAYFLFQPPNWEAAGRVGVNVTPEIPSWCTPQWCPPCIPYCYPRGWSWVNARWCPPCIPPICTPRIPAVRLNFGFKVRNSSFSFSTYDWDQFGDPVEFADYVQYPNPYRDVWGASTWEKPWQPVAYDPEGLYEIVWLTNFRQIGKVSTTPSDPLTQAMTVTTLTDPAKGNAKGGPVRFLQSGSVVVPEGSPEVGVRMHWGSNDVFSESDLAFTITLPSGKNVQLEDEATLDELENSGLSVVVDFNAEERSAWVFFLDAPKGDYKVNVESPRKFSELVFDLIQENESGIIDIDEPYIDPDDGELVVWWYDMDIDSNAAVSVALLNNRNDDQGFEIFNTTEDDPGDESLFGFTEGDFDELLDSESDRTSQMEDEDESDGLLEGEIGLDGWQYVSISPDDIIAPPGEYYVVATISDGYGPPVRKVSATTVTINQTKSFRLNSQRKVTYQPKGNGQGALVAQELPAQVTGIRSRPEFDGFSIQWKPVTNSLVNGYTVEYSTNTVPGTYESSQAVPADKTEARVSGLVSGMPYLVRVSAVGADGQPGAAGEVMTIVPTPGFGRTPPVYRSAAPLVGFPGLQYTYYPRLFDGDLLHLSDTNSAAHTNHGPNGEPLPDITAGYNFVLLAGPDGMTVDPSGIVLWTPTANQIGTNVFILHAFEVNAKEVGDESVERTLKISQTNTIVVIDPDAKPKEIPTPGNRFFAPLGFRPKGGKPVPPEPKNFNGIEPLVFRFLSTPPAYVRESDSLDFMIAHNADPKSVTLELLQGPSGMRLENLNHLLWTVPVGASGSKVVVRASVVPVAGAKPEEFLFDFYLPVHRIDNQLSSPAQILIDATSNSTKLSILSRNADPTALPRSYKLQVKTDDLGAEWKDLMEIPVDRVAAMKSMLIPNSTITVPASQAATFYRVLNID